VPAYGPDAWAHPGGPAWPPGLQAFSQRRVTGKDEQPGPRYRREPSGTVRITSLFDEHYATAEIVTGAPGIHDTVELPRP
jgi:hypothetical protein